MALLLAPATAACSRPGEGALRPQASPGVVLARRSLPGDTAEVRQGAVITRIWGDWGSDAGETITIDYHNAGTGPVAIRVDRIAVAFGEQVGAVEQISDVSGVDLVDADTRNDVGRSLMNDAQAPDTPGTLPLRAGQARRIEVTFGPFPDRHRPRLHDRLTLTVPFPSGTAGVPFECGGP